MSKGIIVLAFAGTGKTSCAKKHSNVYDFDYLLYKYSYPKEIMETKTFEEFKPIYMKRYQNRRTHSEWIDRMNENFEKNVESLKKGMFQKLF